MSIDLKYARDIDRKQFGIRHPDHNEDTEYILLQRSASRSYTDAIPDGVRLRAARLHCGFIEEEEGQLLLCGKNFSS